MAEHEQGAPLTPGSGGVLTLSPGQRVGASRYTLLRQLGQGGMGQVWLARDEQLGEEVALKFLVREITHDADALEDLRRETLKSRRLSHPNIIRIHDLHQAPGEAPFISMEFIQGTPLSVLKSQQPQRLFPWTFVQPLVRQLCEALEYAHKQKVIHRDLKPANMMVNAEGELKLADFGIAATASDSLSRLTGHVGSSGTPAYMSPQQMNSQAPRVTDDVYALGATLYELLTSKPPFYGGDVYRQVQDKPATPLDQRLADLELSKEIPADVAALIMACLAKEPAQRPQSAGAVAEWIGLGIGSRHGVEKLAQQVSPPQFVESRETFGAESPATPQHGGPDATGEVEQPLDQPGEPWEESDVPNAIAAPPARSGRMALWTGLAMTALALLVTGGWFALTKVRQGATPVPSADPANSSLTGKADSAPTTASDATPAPAVSTSAIPLPTALRPVESGWIELFNGRDLTGWRAPNPNPWWTVSNGILTGRHDAKIGGHVLETIQSYGDFVVEWEARWQGNADSGVFVRAGQKIQCQIGLSPKERRDMTAAIFLSSGGYPAEAKDLKRLLKPGDWNQFRFEAKGPRFRIWLKDAQVVDYTNASITNPGPIGLQIMPSAKGMKIEFRNIRIQPLDSMGATEPGRAVDTQKATGSPNPIPITGASDAGTSSSSFVSLFNGRDLTGWLGNPRIWSVQNGVITGIGTRTSPIASNTFLIWRGGTVDDFELRLSFKITAGNSGVQYRSKVVNAAGWVLSGYQFEIDAEKPATVGMLFDERGTRSIMAGAGEKVFSPPAGRRPSALGSPAATCRPNDWNTLTIMAQGNRLVYQLNGVPVAELTDGETTKAASTGVLALQVHKGNNLKVQFKDVQLKRLTASASNR